MHPPATAANAQAPTGAIPPRIGQTRIGLWFWLLTGLGLIGAAMLYVFDPARYGFYPACALYRTTGLFCPGCGSLRAMHQLLHGHLIEALRFNALFVFSVPFVVGFAGLWLTRTLKDQPFSLPVKPWWIWIGLVVVFLFAIARNLPLVRAHGLTP